MASYLNFIVSADHDEKCAELLETFIRLCPSYAPQPDELPPDLNPDTRSIIFRNEAGELHRDGDKPAFVELFSTMIWAQHGQRHRDGDKPAVISKDGTRQWFAFGKRHRPLPKPAIVWGDGSEDFWVDGVEIIEDEDFS